MARQWVKTITSLLTEQATIGLLFLVSLLLSLVFLILFADIGPAEHQTPGSDYFVRYEPIAKSIREGRGVPFWQSTYVTGTPAYPLFLIGVFIISEFFAVNELALVIFFNTIMTGLGVCLFYRLIKELGEKKIAFLSAFFWAGYPLNLWLIKNPNTEVPFILVLFTALLLLIKGMRREHLWSTLGSGILLGIAILIRPFGLYLPFILLPFFFLQKRVEQGCLNPYTSSIVFLLGAGLIIMPWILYASLTTGNFIPVVSIGPSATVIGLSYATVGNGEHLNDLPRDVQMFMERVRNENLQTGREIFRFLLSEFIEKPIPFLKILGLKLMRSWYATYGMWWETKLILLQLPYLLTGGVGIYLALKKYKQYRNRIWIYVLLSLIAYFWFMTFLGLSIVRYMLPAMAFLMVFCAYTLYSLYHRYYKFLWHTS